MNRSGTVQPDLIVNKMNKSIFGIETEFGCMTRAEQVRGTSEGVAARVRDYVFDALELGLRDIHYRDWGEPPGNGGFLYQWRSPLY